MEWMNEISGLIPSKEKLNEWNVCVSFFLVGEFDAIELVSDGEDFLFLLFCFLIF